MRKEYMIPEMEVVIMTEDVVKTSTELPEDPIGENWLMSSWSE